jgi:hypothetical protein
LVGLWGRQDRRDEGAISTLAALGAWGAPLNEESLFGLLHGKLPQITPPFLAAALSGVAMSKQIAPAQQWEQVTLDSEEGNGRTVKMQTVISTSVVPLSPRFIAAAVNTIKDHSATEPVRLAAVYALGCLGEELTVKVSSFETIQREFTAEDVNVHAALIKMTAKEGGARGRASVRTMFREYSQWLFDSVPSTVATAKRRRPYGGTAVPAEESGVMDKLRNLLRTTGRIVRGSAAPKAHEARNLRTSPQVLAAFIDEMEDFDALYQLWQKIERGAYGGFDQEGNPTHPFQFWTGLDRRNYQADKLLAAFVSACHRLGREARNQERAAVILDRIKGLPGLERSSVRIKAIEALGRVGGEKAWESLLKELPQFPFNQLQEQHANFVSRVIIEMVKRGELPGTVKRESDGSMVATLTIGSAGQAEMFTATMERVAELLRSTPSSVAPDGFVRDGQLWSHINSQSRLVYIRYLVGDLPLGGSKVHGQAVPLPTRRLNGLELAALARALGGFPCRQSLQILETLAGWALRFSKSAAVVLPGEPSVHGAIFPGASYVEENVVRSLIQMINTEKDKTDRDQALFDAVCRQLFDMVASTISTYSGSTPALGGAKRLANRPVLNAYVDAICLLVDVGHFGGGVEFDAFSAMQARYDLAEIFQAVYRGMAIMNPGKFIAHVRERLPAANPNEKIGIAHGLGEVIRIYIEMERAHAEEVQAVVRPCREMLYGLLGDTGNMTEVRKEALQGLAPLKDCELEQKLIAHLCDPQLPKPFERELTEEILKVLAGFGGEETLKLLVSLIEGRAEFKIDYRLDVAKLATDALFLFARRLQGKEMKLRPYEREKGQETRSSVRDTLRTLRSSLSFRRAGLSF